jgi:ketosteroid isomerase-like protein
MPLQTISAENVEIVRCVYEAVARNDPAEVLALYDPEVEWDFSRSPVGDVMGRKFYRGHEGLREWWRDWREAWENWEDNYTELIAAGTYVISTVESRGRGRTSGVQIDRTQYGVWTIRNGRVVRVVWFRTRAEAFEAVTPSA